MRDALHVHASRSALLLALSKDFIREANGKAGQSNRSNEPHGTEEGLQASKKAVDMSSCLLFDVCCLLRVRHNLIVAKNFHLSRNQEKKNPKDNRKKEENIKCSKISRSGNRTPIAAVKKRCM